MAIEHGPKGGEIDRILGQELADPDAVFRTADPKRGGHHMLGAQRSDLDRGRRGVDLDLDLDGLVETLRIEIVRDGQKLYRPSFDDDTLLPEFRVSGLPQIGKYGLQAHETGSRLLSRIADREQYVEIIGQRRLDVVECGDSTSDRISFDCAIRNHAVDHLKRTLHARHWSIRSGA
jgi:hypothetical protein